MDLSRRLKFLAGLINEDEDYGVGAAPVADAPVDSVTTDVPAMDPMAAPEPTAFAIINCAGISEKLNQAAAKLDDVISMLSAGQSAEPTARGAVGVDLSDLNSKVKDLQKQVKDFETQIDAAYAKMVNTQGEDATDQGTGETPLDAPAAVSVDIAVATPMDDIPMDAPVDEVPMDDLPPEAPAGDDTLPPVDDTMGDMGDVPPAPEDEKKPKEKTDLNLFKSFTQ